MFVFEFNFSRQQDQPHPLHLECTSLDLVGCFVIEIILEFQQLPDFQCSVQLYLQNSEDPWLSRLWENRSGQEEGCI